MHVTPYLNFDGDCRAAVEHYAACLGGTIEAMTTHGESPVAGDVPSEWHDRILHARLVADEVVLMASDTPPGQYRAPGSLYVSLHVEDVGRAERIFDALSEGGRVQMPFEETFWAERFGMCVDRFGIPWMVNCDRAA